jgi:hypothetical protein
MLHTLRANILHDRSDMIEGDEDHLWTDATLCRYIDEAIRRFAKLTLCIRDGTTPQYTQFQTVAYQKMYPLDPTVLAVLSVRSLGNGTWVNGVYTGSIQEDKADLARAGHANFDTYREPDTYYFNPNWLSQLPPGKPLAYDTDEYTVADTNGSVGVMAVRLYPIVGPTWAGATMQMRVARMPQARYLNTDLDVIPEIPEDFHLGVLDYAAYLALRIVDHDLGDPERAEEFRQSFARLVDEAKAEMQKKQFAESLFGFGRNGFSYTGN